MQRLHLLLTLNAVALFSAPGLLIVHQGVFHPVACQWSVSGMREHMPGKQDLNDYAAQLSWMICLSMASTRTQHSPHLACSRGCTHRHMTCPHTTNMAQNSSRPYHVHKTTPAGVRFAGHGPYGGHACPRRSLHNLKTMIHRRPMSKIICHSGYRHLQCTFEQNCRLSPAHMTYGVSDRCGEDSASYFLMPSTHGQGRRPRAKI